MYEICTQGEIKSDINLLSLSADNDYLNIYNNLVGLRGCNQEYSIHNKNSRSKMIRVFFIPWLIEIQKSKYLPQSEDQITV